MAQLDVTQSTISVTSSMIRPRPRFLYYSGRRLVPPPLRAFVDFVRSSASTATPPR
ncbi:hypothetical protein BH11PSE3_BH11PSE3_04470 [soil metagenome]